MYGARKCPEGPSKRRQLILCVHHPKHGALRNADVPGAFFGSILSPSECYGPGLEFGALVMVAFGVAHPQKRSLMLMTTTLQYDKQKQRKLRIERPQSMSQPCLH